VVERITVDRHASQLGQDRFRIAATYHVPSQALERRVSRRPRILLQVNAAFKAGAN
jgi:hypothetical protein